MRAGGRTGSGVGTGSAGTRGPAGRGGGSASGPVDGSGPGTGDRTGNGRASKSDLTAREGAGSDPVERLAHLLEDGTAALAKLDVEALERLEALAQSYLQNPRGPISVQTNAPGQARMPAASRIEEIASRHRVFSQVLEATKGHVDLETRLDQLRRPAFSGEFNSWDR